MDTTGKVLPRRQFMQGLGAAITAGALSACDDQKVERSQLPAALSKKPGDQDKSKLIKELISSGLIIPEGKQVLEAMTLGEVLIAKEVVASEDRSTDDIQSDAIANAVSRLIIKHYTKETVPADAKIETRIVTSNDFAKYSKLVLLRYMSNHDRAKIDNALEALTKSKSEAESEAKEKEYRTLIKLDERKEAYEQLAKKIDPIKAGQIVAPHKHKLIARLVEEGLAKPNAPEVTKSWSPTEVHVANIHLRRGNNSVIDTINKGMRHFPNPFVPRGDIAKTPEYKIITSTDYGRSVSAINFRGSFAERLEKKLAEIKPT